MTSNANESAALALGRSRADVAAPAFALVFSELVQYHQSRSRDTHALERALEDAGAEVGRRSYESTSYREKSNGSKRDNRLLPLLQFIQTACWKSLFGRAADSLQVYDDDEYLLSDRDCLVNRFISVPKDLGDLNCGAFVAGVVRGILHSAGFPAKVSAYYSEPNPATDVNGARTTNILMKFDREVIEREARLGG